MSHTNRTLLKQHMIENGVHHFLYENHPNAIYTVDKQGHFVDANPALCRLTGYEVSEFLEKNWGDLVAPEDVPRVMNHFHLTMEGTLQQYDCRVLHQNGHWLNLSITNLPLTVEDKVVGIYAIAKERGDVRLFSRNAERIAKLGSWEWDIQENSVWWSDEVYRILGTELHSFGETYDAFLSFVHPEDREFVLDSVRNSLHCDHPHDFEHRVICLDGTEKTVHQRAELLQDASGRPTLMIGVMQDITDRKLTEEALRKSESSLAHAQAIAHIGNWDFDLEKKEWQCSEELCRIYGVDPAIYSTGHLYDIFVMSIHPDDQVVVKRAIASALESGTIDLEYRLMRPDRSIRVVHAQGNVMLEENGKPIRLVGTVHDVTDQKEAERLLLESEMRYQSLVKYNPDGVCAFDRQGFFVETNPAYERIFGYTSEELVGMTYQDLLLPEDLEAGTQLFRQAMRGELREKVEMMLKHKQGYRVEVTFTVVPIVVNQEIVGFYCILKDITEQKQTEELLRKSEKLSVVGQLAAGVAHEIRNPLTALKGFVQLMQVGASEDKKYLDIMASELNRIELIVSEFLVLSKPQAIRFRFQSIYEILRDVTALIDTQAILNNVQVVTDFEEELPPIKCDPNQLKQVFINFLKNSIEAMPLGGLIQIHVRRLGQDRLLVCFIDQGCGIPDELISKLGEPFYSTKEKGTGLGLMVSKKIIELHHGELQIRSEVNVGTTIEVILPVTAG